MHFIDFLGLFFIFGFWMILIEAVKFVIVVKLGKDGVNKIVKQLTDAALSGALKAVMKYKLEREHSKPAPVYPKDFKKEWSEADEMSDLR